MIVRPRRALRRHLEDVSMSPDKRAMWEAADTLMDEALHVFENEEPTLYGLMENDPNFPDLFNSATWAVQAAVTRAINTDTPVVEAMGVVYDMMFRTAITIAVDAVMKERDKHNDH